MRNAYAPKVRTSLSTTDEAALRKVMDAPAPVQSQDEIMRNMAAYVARKPAKTRNKYGY